ncbi:hypothetical protein CWIS_14675 [Cellulomonas sp. A375-1]|nr:hypothetical protein CWIS_14675 [Cellulomonas sp. A375-1]
MKRTARTEVDQPLGPGSTGEGVTAAIAELGPPEALAASVEHPRTLTADDRRAVTGAVVTAVTGLVLLVLLPPAGALVSLLALAVGVWLRVRRPDLRRNVWLGVGVVLAAVGVAAAVYWFVFARGSSTEVVLHDPVPSAAP